MTSTYMEQQNKTLTARLAEAQMQIKRLDADLQSLAHRLADTTRHRDELLVEVEEMSLLVERSEHVIGNAMLAHAEILRRIDLVTVDPALADAVRSLSAALRGHFIDD